MELLHVMLQQNVLSIQVGGVLVSLIGQNGKQVFELSQLSQDSVNNLVLSSFGATPVTPSHLFLLHD